MHAHAPEVRARLGLPVGALALFRLIKAVTRWRGNMQVRTRLDAMDVDS